MRVVITALAASILYATVRYNVFKGVPWADWPTYVLNKAFAVGAILLLAIYVLDRQSSKSERSSQALYFAGLFTAMHWALSFVLLSPAYYEKFFVAGKLTSAIGTSLTLGAMAAVLMALGGRMQGHWGQRGRDLRIAIVAILVGMHAALQGFSGWFLPADWPGSLPPMSMVAFVLSGVAVWGAFRRK